MCLLRFSRELKTVLHVYLIYIKYTLHKVATVLYFITRLYSALSKSLHINTVNLLNVAPTPFNPNP